MKNKYLSLGLLALGMFFAQSTFAQTDAEKQKLIQSYDQGKLSAIETTFQTKAQAEKEEAYRIAQQRGWDVTIEMPNGRFLELQRVVDGKPIYYSTFNVDAARSTRTDHLNAGGSLGLNLMGQNMTAGVWDGGGTRPTHQEFDGPGGTNRVTIIDGSTLNGNSFHAQHVTGTIMAAGIDPAAKGMAPHARARTADWNNDKAEVVSEAAAGLLISNHSYGFGFRNQFGQVQLPQYFFGGYIDESRDWDEISFNAPGYLMVVAAGNDGADDTANNNPTGGAGFDKLTGHSTSKNTLVVANARDANVDANGNLISVTINNGSSEGPTDDFRIKPDITGNGTGVYSAFASSDTAYNSITGTSMASPNVAGSLLLLQQHYNNTNGSFMRGATLKGLALHTADDTGVSGPDAVYGWGLMNTKRAAETITSLGSSESRIEELTLTSGQSYTITVDSDGVSPLLASISWTDRAGTAVTTVNSTTPVLVNDLDIRVTRGGTTYFPYELTGALSSAQQDNNVDPYERVDISGASGTYTITVTHKGSLVGGSQDFSLIVTGLTGTPVVCNATTPTGVAASNITASSADINWNDVANATYTVRFRQSGTSAWTTGTVTSNSATLTGLAGSTSYQVQVRSECPGGSSAYSSTVTFTTAAAPAFCSGSITTFPYSEGFESNDGWTQVGGDDGDWYRTSGSTPSSGTGPTAAAEGSSYLFLEASTNNSPGQIGTNATAILESDCFDLSGKTAATFSFQNHMYGTDVGSLTVQASTDGSSWANLWTDSGDKGNQWNAVSVNLNAYLGQEIKLRIVGTTGAGWSSDIAIDDLAVTANDGSSAGGCSGGISSFPYSESFENTFGAWSQSTADDINWSVTSGTTPSGNTGPSAATDGTFYIFVEASGDGTGYPNKQAILNSPCFDLSGETQASFNFSYHMFGAADMGSIALEASDNDGATWATLWSQTGNQGNTWQTASVDLASYTGGSVQLRFNRITGATWQADIAIDGVSLSTGGGTGPSCSNVSLSITFDNYPEETSWEIRNSGGQVVASGGTYGSEPDGSTLNIDVGCLDDGCYDFIISDSFGDGICCTYGNGSFTLTNGDTGAVLASGGSFTASDTTNFCLSASGTTSTNSDFRAAFNDDRTTTSLDVKIYPNPVRGGALNVTTTQDNATYTILNMVGQQVAKGNIVSGVIDVQRLEAGVYMVQINAGTQSVTKKFIKQ